MKILFKKKHLERKRKKIESFGKIFKRINITNSYTIYISDTLDNKSDTLEIYGIMTNNIKHITYYHL